MGFSGDAIGAGEGVLEGVANQSVARIPMSLVGERVAEFQMTHAARTGAVRAKLWWRKEKSVTKARLENVVGDAAHSTGRQVEPETATFAAVVFVAEKVVHGEGGVEVRHPWSEKVPQKGRLALELPAGRRERVVAIAVQLGGRAVRQWDVLEVGVVVGLESLEVFVRDQASGCQKAAGGPERREVSR